MCFSCWVIFGRFLFSNPQRIGRIKVQYSVVLDVNLGHAIVGCRQQKAVVKSDLKRSRFQVAIPVGAFAFFAESQMPLADDGCLLIGSLQDRRQSFHAWPDDRRTVWRRDAGSFFAKRVAACQERVASRCASRRTAVAASKSQTFACEPIDIRCRKFSGSVTRNVSVTEVVCHNHDDVRRTIFGRQRTDAG